MAESIWKRQWSLDKVNEIGGPTLMGHLGIEFTAIADDYLEAKMQVEMYHCQPAGIMHGGTSVVIAETLGSVGAILTLPEDKLAVGIEVSTSHLKAVPCGSHITAKAWPLRLGGRTQVWQIDIYYQQQVSASTRLTLAVVNASNRASTGSKISSTSKSIS